MLRLTKKYQAIIDNKHNGNITDSFNSIHKLPKKQLCELMALVTCDHCVEFQNDYSKRAFIIFIWNAVQG